MTTVVVAMHLGEESLRRIREVDPRVRVAYREELVPPPRWEGDLVGEPGWRLNPEKERELLGLLAGAEVLLDFPRIQRPLPEVAHGLRWVQGSMAGAGPVAARAGLLDTDVVITTASGVFSGPLAEFVLGGMLHHAKDFERLRKNRLARRWSEEPTGTLEGKTLCIVGMGSIGRAIAGRARPFGMRIVGVKRTVREDDPAREYADELLPVGKLRAALARADYVAVTLPHTPETERLLDEEAIAAIKPGAYFANVGRGAVVDEAALVRALRSGHLSGAALDVFETEPLPQDSPLWELENVIISPHSTDNVPRLMEEKLVGLFCENLRRYLAGEELLNVLDKRLLY
ncbi:2-hydroxyacid dehydrogenase [Rubrobacter xylanophilus]|uniref:2-hydroxyacid dehydrogenase n=1 Tax=Rubrobacter xylanophilus TaxID=49319 RepID=A0A510HNF0_9ACTN|nr:D-2-hydroxyacid dehydrogenase [Rubrobacter xylanophilus]BBL80067.1 2-hydroxyacid dehydrogenase [Rubrobacter xylanophilus]